MKYTIEEIEAAFTTHYDETNGDEVRPQDLIEILQRPKYEPRVGEVYAWRSDINNHWRFTPWEAICATNKDVERRPLTLEELPDWAQRKMKAADELRDAVSDAFTCGPTQRVVSLGGERCDELKIALAKYDEATNADI